MRCYIFMFTISKHKIVKQTPYIYRINSVIRRSFLFPNNPKDLDPSDKTDLDLKDCSGKEFLDRSRSLKLFCKKKKTHFITEIQKTDLHISGTVILKG